jgi:hypothetical protein
MDQIDERDVDFIAVGAAILGSGGGGDPYVGKLMAKQAVREHGPVRLIPPEEVPDDELIIPSAMMGAPAVMLEKLPNGGEPELAFRALEKYLDRTAYGVISIEAGGLNSCIPIYTAAKLGLPLVDADGMGRAFPELQMVTFSVAGVPSTPMALCDEKGNRMILETVTNQWSEVLARTATVAMGLSSMLSIYCVNGRTLKQSAVRGTLSTAAEIGRRILRSNRSEEDPVAAILRVTRGFRLFDGKISDISRDLTTGFVRGRVLIEGTDEDKGAVFEIEFQNENLLARRNNRLAAVTPDLITVLDRESAFPITTEGLKYGQRVVVIGMPCDPFWRSERGLAHVGPRYFNYDTDYTPVEVLAERRAS